LFGQRPDALAVDAGREFVRSLHGEAAGEQVAFGQRLHAGEAVGGLVAVQRHALEHALALGLARRQRHGVDQRRVHRRFGGARLERIVAKHGQRQRLRMFGQQLRQPLAHQLVGLEGAGIGLEHGVNRERATGQLHRHWRLGQRVDLEIAPFHHRLEFNAPRHIGQGLRHRQQ
jgi:hypothetical protein